MALKAVNKTLERNKGARDGQRRRRKVPAKWLHPVERSSNKPKPQRATVAKKAHQATEDKIANPRRNPTPPIETKRRLAEPTSDIVAMTTDPSPRRPYTPPRLVPLHPPYRHGDLVLITSTFIGNL